nr:hypothetical protein [Tanacetum cinerariifolium]
MVNDEEDDAEVINPYEEADPHNRPPPTSDEETEFAPPVVQIADANDVPIPPVIQFGSNFHSVHRGVKRLSKQMHDMCRTEKKMANKLRQDELHMNGQEFNITALDSEEPFIYTAPVPRADDPYVMVRDAAMDTQGDEDVDIDAPRDTQPSEPRRSPRDSQIMPPKRRSQTNPQATLTQEAVNQLVRDGIEAAIRDEQERVRWEATRAGGPAGGPAAAPMARECLFSGFMKCGPTHFTRLKVATLGREVVNGRPWSEVKHMMTDEFCPTKEVQRFNELALLCPDAVPNEKKMVELYIKGLSEIINGETTSFRPVMLNEAMHMSHALMELKIQAKNERIAEGLKRK